MSEVQLAIEGMSCGHCVRTVRDALTALPGVTPSIIGVGSATLVVYPETATVDDVLAALHDVGYDATVRAAAPVA